MRNYRDYLDKSKKSVFLTKYFVLINHYMHFIIKSKFFARG